MSPVFNNYVLKILCVLLMTCAFVNSVFATQAGNKTLVEAWNASQFYFNLRYRYEHVDDDFQIDRKPLKSANASTLRTVAGYRSGDFHGFSTLLELEQISRIFSGSFSDGTGATGSGVATVADPDGTELNQGYLRYQGLASNDLRLGRQAITYRDAPYHRHIGTILWRQNWQTFDAISIENTWLPNTKIDYAYVWKVNRIFGRSAPEPLSYFSSDSHLLNLQNNQRQWAQVEAYSYLLEFNNAPRFSSQTYGIRLHGSHSLNNWFSPLYTAEYAYQSDYNSNSNNYTASYQLFEAGFRLVSFNYLDNLELKLGFERLSGDGSPNGAFVTILGTNHAFQGTADRFLVTPDDGIRDYHLRTGVDVGEFKFKLGYHMLRSDNMDYQYGKELDLELTRQFGKHLSIGLKYAYYDGDSNTLNLMRNPILAADVTKAWFYTVVNF